MVKLRSLVAAVPESQGHSLLTQGFASVGRSCLVYGQCLAILVGHSRLDILTSEIIFTAILFHVWFFKCYVAYCGASFCLGFASLSTYTDFLILAYMCRSFHRKKICLVSS